MVIGAFPFSVVMVLQGVALLKAIFRDTQRVRAGVPRTSACEPEATPAE